jgi:Zn ribbon nucleic-acid-binding protein
MDPVTHAMRVTSADNETVGSFQVELYSPRQAARKGVKMALTALFLAILSVVLPVIHFVSVPLGILASPFVGIYYYLTRKGTPKCMTADFVCPDCQASNHVAAPKMAELYESVCVQCQHKIQLTPLSGPDCGA